MQLLLPWRLASLTRRVVAAGLRRSDKGQVRCLHYHTYSICFVASLLAGRSSPLCWRSLTILAGVAGYLSRPVAQYPDITPPTIEVFAVYRRARLPWPIPLLPIEQQVDGGRHDVRMSSTCGNDGSYTPRASHVQARRRLNIAHSARAEPREPRGTGAAGPREASRRYREEEVAETSLMIINLRSTTEKPAELTEEKWKQQELLRMRQLRDDSASR